MCGFVDCMELLSVREVGCASLGESRAGPSRGASCLQAMHFALPGFNHIITSILRMSC